MIILHNSLDQGSRVFLDDLLISLGTTLGVFSGGVATSADAKHTVFDWYTGGREAFWALPPPSRNTHGVSDFPSVIVEIPAHRIPANEGGLGQPQRNVPRNQVALRKPIDIGAIDDFLAETNIGLARSAAAGKPVTPLTRDNMSKRKT